MADAAYLATLPRTRGAASALLTDDGGRILLVKPTYRPGWLLPGGVIEAGESPLAACLRECQEELGLRPRLDGLVCFDWVPPEGEADATNVWVFAGRLDPEEIARIELPPDELSDHVLASPDELGDFTPPHITRRIAGIVAASGHPVYLEAGVHPEACAAPAPRR
ncbi:ADP-ribose pyrophosphatase YjhB (NUDIX family) [Actinocorallia herbida]|uniref:ADP-ribose pyrophosphatase YjhB (NUDIX family) n=1 Tax=Actinocorallia herbida TaxID=58109 RepID=A0A3N1CVA1_9ACTN|nr:NUDIX hydrolase [Actinocorallia herbida]ROO84638.1 ADP-ribose pyrophosphatase YjhB (NUDIX family) [Actinocorallia herbida]